MKGFLSLRLVLTLLPMAAILTTGCRGLLSGDDDFDPASLEEEVEGEYNAYYDEACHLTYQILPGLRDLERDLGLMAQDYQRTHGARFDDVCAALTAEFQYGTVRGASGLDAMKYVFVRRARDLYQNIEGMTSIEWESAPDPDENELEARRNLAFTLTHDLAEVGTLVPSLCRPDRFTASDLERARFLVHKLVTHPLLRDADTRCTVEEFDRILLRNHAPASRGGRLSDSDSATAMDAGVGAPGAGSRGDGASTGR